VEAASDVVEDFLGSGNGPVDFPQDGQRTLLLAAVDRGVAGVLFDFRDLAKRYPDAAALADRLRRNPHRFDLVDILPVFFRVANHDSDVFAVAGEPPRFAAVQRPSDLTAEIDEAHAGDRGRLAEPQLHFALPFVEIVVEVEHAGVP